MADSSPQALGWPARFDHRWGRGIAVLHRSRWRRALGSTRPAGRPAPVATVGTVGTGPT